MKKKSLLKIKSLHGITLEHGLCHIICVKLHKEKQPNMRDNWQCLLFGNEGPKQNCAAKVVNVSKCRFVSLMDVGVDW